MKTYIYHSIIILALFLSFVNQDKSAQAEALNSPPGQNCSVTELEAQLDQTLAQNNPTGLPFTYSIERTDGRRYSYSYRDSSLQTSYESASTSKLVTAVIILRLVELGYLDLSDSPQDYITDWPITEGDNLYTMNLADLLSFTSGLWVSPPPAEGFVFGCLDSPNSNIEDCVHQIGMANSGSFRTPGAAFYYASTHLQVAGLMAIRARFPDEPERTWQDVFNEFKESLVLFPTSSYDLPSADNPRLAGGMHWTGQEYMAFLKALKNGEILSPEYLELLLADHTAPPVVIRYSPIELKMGEEWHYGFGLWQECQSESYNCIPGTRVSSPGALGAYPFWDTQKRYFGIVARQDQVGSFPEGIHIDRSVRELADAWAHCKQGQDEDKPHPRFTRG